MRNFVSAFDYRSLSGETAPELVFGKFSESHDFIVNDADFEKGRLLGIFPQMPPEFGDDGPFYYFLTETGDNDYMLAVLWNGKKYPVICGKNPQGEFTISGLEEELRPIQANIFKISEHNYRMYFWAHFHGTPRKVRMLIAESSDRQHWQIINGGRPAFCHYSDTLCTQGLFPVTRQCNDATTIYQQSDGTFEVLSAALIHLDANSQTRYYQKDIWRGYVRVIQRWVGDGFENWSQPEIVALPDSNDPIDLQFYYLCANKLPHGNFGWLGRFSVATQKMSMEPVWSQDRRHWVRPFRKSLGPEPEKPIVAPAHHMAEVGDKFRMYYSCGNYDHNFQTMDGSRPQKMIRYAEIDQRRLFGCQLNNSAILSPALRMDDPALELYTSADADLSFVWRNAFGEISDKPIKAAKNVPGVWQLAIEDCKPGCTGALEIRGKGQVFDLKY